MSVPGLTSDRSAAGVSAAPVPGVLLNPLNANVPGVRLRAKRLGVRTLSAGAGVAFTPCMGKQSGEVAAAANEPEVRAWYIIVHHVIGSRRVFTCA
jgi:hypothetical protein